MQGRGDWVLAVSPTPEPALGGGQPLLRLVELTQLMCSCRRNGKLLSVAGTGALSPLYAAADCAIGRMVTFHTGCCVLNPHCNDEIRGGGEGDNQGVAGDRSVASPASLAPAVC